MRRKSMPPAVGERFGPLVAGSAATNVPVGRPWKPKREDGSQEGLMALPTFRLPLIPEKNG